MHNDNNNLNRDDYIALAQEVYQRLLEGNLEDNFRMQIGQIAIEKALVAAGYNEDRDDGYREVLGLGGGRKQFLETLNRNSMPKFDSPAPGQW